jgi:UDP-N-acetylmuramate--alanine ligase
VNARRVHLVGIGGTGLASLASYLLGRGDRVSGCDLKDGSIVQRLRERGAAVSIGHAADHVSGELDALVYTAAAPREHPELAAAAQQGVASFKYAQFLGRETHGKQCLAVAGTHGKTTTSALLAEILVGARFDPSAVLGGFPSSWPLPGRFGVGPHFVVEACEYDRSFQNFAPRVALVTNCEPDHLDYFGTHENVVKAFAAFLGNVESGGVALLHESAAPALARGLARSIVVGESSDADARLERRDAERGCGRGRLDARRGGVRVVVDLALAVPGDHVLVDAALAATAALELGVEPRAVEAAVAAFRGVRRRLEFVGTRAGVRFLSDYAHHPTEIRAVRLALRAAHPAQRIVVVFQPHQAGRTRDFRDEFARELAAFDDVVIPNIFSVRESAEGVERETANLVEAIRARGRPVVRTRGLDEVTAALATIAHAGDVVVLTGAGDVDDLAEPLRAEPTLEEARVARAS